jgi:hypothetical protein
MAYRFMQANQGRYTVTETAVLLGVCRSAYYQRAKNGASNRCEQAGAGLARLVRETVTKHCHRYGSPRVRRGLRSACGKRAGLKKVARLMRGNGLNAKRRGKFVHTADSKHGLAALETAVKNRMPQGGLIFHPGRGSSIAPNLSVIFCMKSALRPGRA